MRISQKIRKLFSLDGYYSVRAGIRRWSYPLDPKPFIDAIDREGFEKLRARFGKPDEKVLPEKYLDLDEWLPTNVKRVRDLRLPKAPPRLRILDLGCGSGYFLHIARCLGHDAVGMDLDTEPVFNETLRLLGIPRIVHAILPFQPLPEMGAPFDLITAHMTCFNRRADGSHWGVEEWDYFLKDAESRLTPGGRIQLDLNVLPDGRHMAPDVKQFFLGRGARIDRRRVFFPPRTSR
ncbi:MAG: class I SAM-dependent methyltransferase [Chthoniobacteraceae bacterium]